MLTLGNFTFILSCCWVPQAKIKSYSYWKYMTALGACHEMPSQNCKSNHPWNCDYLTYRCGFKCSGLDSSPFTVRGTLYAKLLGPLAEQTIQHWETFMTKPHSWQNFPGFENCCKAKTQASFVKFTGLWLNFKQVWSESWFQMGASCKIQIQISNIPLFIARVLVHIHF